VPLEAPGGWGRAGGTGRIGSDEQGHRILGLEQPSDVPSRLVCIDLERMDEQSAWTFSAGSYGQSPVFVPDAGGGDGWVIMFVQYADRTELQVFDALALGRGPVATATAPGLKQSFQVHSGFMPDARSQETGYRRSFSADLGQGWKRLPAAAHPIVEDVLRMFG
jgi:hypothetical protein